MIQVTELAKRYASALSQVLKSDAQTERALSELRELSKMLLGDHAIESYMSSPVVLAETKASGLELALAGKFQAETLNFLKLVIAKDRFSLIPQIALALEQIVDNKNGIVRGEVRSAAALDSDQRGRMEASINKVTGKKVVLNYVKDEKMGSGIRAQVAGWTFDDSLDSHLTLMRESLTN